MVHYENSLSALTSFFSLSTIIESLCLYFLKGTVSRDLLPLFFREVNDYAEIVS